MSGTLCTPSKTGAAVGAVTGAVVWALMSFVPAFHNGVPEAVVAVIPVALAWIGHTAGSYFTAHKPPVAPVPAVPVPPVPAPPASVAAPIPVPPVAAPAEPLLPAVPVVPPGGAILPDHPITPHPVTTDSGPGPE